MTREELDRRNNIKGALAVISGRITDPVWACDAVGKDFPRYGDPWTIDEVKEHAEALIFKALFPNHLQEMQEIDE